MHKNLLNSNSIVLAIVLFAFVFTGIAEAQPQFRSMFGASNRNTVQLNLTEDAGPWLVMCASFDGQDGPQQAVNLAFELRKTHKLKAYVYRQHFDFAGDIAERGMGFRKPTSGGKSNLHASEMKLANQSQKTEYAVLVGDYKSIESSQAQHDLATIKKLQPESLQVYSAEIRDTSQAGNRLRADSDAIFSTGDGFKKMSSLANSKFPLRLALLVTNPMLPDEIVAAAEIDQYILRINSDRKLKYSLLGNPKAYTLKVASFSGEVIVRPKDIADREADRLWQNREQHGTNDSGLVDAAKRANILTEYLRSKDVEAYQFHDRYSSYVCVGGFDWVREGDGPNAKGNPEVEALAKVFAAKPVGGGQVTTFPLPARLLEAGVTCDANPLTVAVPRAKARSATLPSLRR